MQQSVRDIFSMSAFEGLRHLRRHRIAYPNFTEADLISLSTKVEIGGFDYEAATVLDGLVADSVDPENPVEFFQGCIEAALSQNLIWTKSITLGRQKFIQKLSRDEVSCFRCAKLLDDPPSDETVAWWDRLQSDSREISSALRTDQGRYAEKLSIDFEIKRLEKLGIYKRPIWMAVEDNTVGYDILSFDLGLTQPITRLIEVKSFAGAPRFFVTRNEWTTAQKFSRGYVFHIWEINREKLHERTVEQLQPQIPSDGEGGQWQEAVLSLLPEAYLQSSKHS
jgi:hypothetical protein